MRSGEPAHWGVGRDRADQLAVGELFDARCSELPPVARPLDATEGKLRPRRRRAVDPHHPGIEASSHALRATDVGCEDRPAEAEGRVVRECDGLVLAGDAVDDGDRPEQLLVVGAHRRRDAGQDGRLHERARKVGAPAADDDRRALGGCVLDLVNQGLRRPLRRQPGECRCGVGRVARRERREAIAHAGHEHGVVLVEHDEALGRHAALAHVLEAAPDRRIDGALQVLGVEHDERVAAAEVERAPRASGRGQPAGAARRQGPRVPGRDDVLSLAPADRPA
jgi:hypothetical protein